MPWKVEFNPGHQIIEYRLAGLITIGDCEAALRQGASLAKEHDCFLFYVDALEVIPKLGVNDLYLIPKLFRPLGIPNTAKVGVFCPPRTFDAMMQRFCETVFFNNNYQIKFFLEPAMAMGWLIGRPANEEIENGKDHQHGPP